MCYALADQHTLRAGLEMLVGAAAGDPSPGPPVVCLHSFPESHGIVSQRHKSLGREISGNPVILGLSQGGVSGGHQDSRITAWPVGPVEVSRHIVTRETFENDLLNRVQLVLETAGNAGVQRSPVAWQPAQDLQQRGSNPLLAALGIVNGPDPRNFVFTLFQLLLGDAIHPAQKSVRRRLSRESKRTEHRRRKQRTGSNTEVHRHLAPVFNRR
jgi:hypothetical protein